VPKFAKMILLSLLALGDLIMQWRSQDGLLRDNIGLEHCYSASYNTKTSFFFEIIGHQLAPPLYSCA
jgi:hypothetical protein